MGWLLALLSGGLFLSMKGKPKTAFKKREAFGPRSGETWDVEDIPDASTIVVHSRRDKTLAVFHKVNGKFVYSQSKGAPTIIAMMRDDFEGT